MVSTENVIKTEVVSVRLSEDEKNRLDLYARNNNWSRNALIREFILQGLSINSYKKDIDMITDIIRESIYAILDPKMERMIALQSKTCVTSASGYFLLTEVIQRLLPPEQRMGAKDSIERARKEAIQYTKQKIETGES